jgi:hypothetical protein
VLTPTKGRKKKKKKTKQKKKQKKTINFLKETMDPVSTRLDSWHNQRYNLIRGKVIGVKKGCLVF